MKVSVVAYGLGNLGSVVNMFKRVGVQSTLVTTPDELLSSERVLLPGVGSFDAGMARLEQAGLVGALRDFAATGRPLLGICLGMQLLLDSSEEGHSRGLSLISGRCLRLPQATGVRIPHMGWSHISPTREDPLIAGVTPENRYYFVHSYRAVPDDEKAVLATADYGASFVSMVRVGNVMGAQFHPEKSHSFGMTILRNFASL